MARSFSEKIFNGEPITSEEWISYLKKAHEVSPGMTSLATNLRVNEEGLDSYQLLARAASRPEKAHQKILDLACGDGHLFSYLEKYGGSFEFVGIDMSKDELSLAQAKKFHSPTRFQLAMAHDTGEEANSFDAITCHMAFMLMVPLEPVVSEIDRLLKSRGVFAAVTPSLRDGDGFDATFRKIRQQYFCETFPRFKMPKLGDDRISTAEGLRELFAAERFHPAQIQPLNLRGRYPHSEIWNYFRNLYLVSSIPEKNRAELQNQVESAAKRDADAEGLVGFNFQYDLITVSKR